MQQIFFAVPAIAKVKTITAKNIRTDVVAGYTRKFTYKVEGKEEDTDIIYLCDASGNPDRSIEYNLFYISNAKADSGTNTYALTLEYEENGGASN
jgi:hypothetical protein